MTAATVAPPARRAAPLRAVDEVWAEPAGNGYAVSARLDISRVDLTGHFPGLPVYPGVFTLESIVQAVATAVGRQLHLCEVTSGRFLGALGPADNLLLQIDAQPIAGQWNVTAIGTRADGGSVIRLKAVLGDPPDPGPEESPPATIGAARMDVAAVEAALPHRHPMLLVDRVTAVEPGVALHAEKAVTATEPCYAGCDDVALEGRAYPASLVLESLGQAAALLWGARVAADEVLMFAGVRGFRVTGSAYPGDVLHHEVRLTHVKAATAFATGRTWAGDRPVAEVATLIAVHRRRSVLDAARVQLPHPDRRPDEPGTAAHGGAS